MKIIDKVLEKDLKNGCNEKEQHQKNIFWNMIASILNSSQTVIFLLIITRELGIIEAGIFSLSFSTANMLINIGNYGVRNYQVTDISYKHSFREYFIVRIITCMVMLIVSIFYGIQAGGINQKGLMIWMLCFLKCLECIEDLFFGEYQLQGRLDIAGKLWTLRLGFNILIFFIFILITKNMVWASFALVVQSSIFIIGNIKCVYPKLKRKQPSQQKMQIKSIFFNATPIFLYSFLSIYICNSPKYAIDAYMSEEAQAYFGVLFMPIFMINLLSGFIYRPILVQLAETWSKKNQKEFFRKVYRQIGFILVITILLCLLAPVIELPILSWLYKMELEDYTKEYIILLIGGACSAISYFLTSCMTAQRNQKNIVFVILGIAIAAFFISDLFVKSQGILGAAILYSSLMLLQMTILLILCQKYKERR